MPDNWPAWRPSCCRSSSCPPWWGPARGRSSRAGSSRAGRGPSTPRSCCGRRTLASRRQPGHSACSGLCSAKHCGPGQASDQRTKFKESQVGLDSGDSQLFLFLILILSLSWVHWGYQGQWTWFLRSPSLQTGIRTRCCLAAFNIIYNSFGDIWS